MTTWMQGLMNNKTQCRTWFRYKHNDESLKYDYFVDNI